MLHASPSKRLVDTDTFQDTGLFGFYGESDEDTLDGYLDELLFAASTLYSAPETLKSLQSNENMLQVSNLAFSVTEEEAFCNSSLPFPSGPTVVRWSEASGS